MKKFLCSIVCFIIFILNFSISANAVSLSEIKQRGYIKVSVNAEFEPFEYRDGSEIVGVDIEIAKKIADSLGVELKINDTSFGSLVFELSGHNCDFVISAMSKTEEKSKSIDFSEPYYTAEQVIVVPSSSNIESENDLTNKKIGVQIGCSGDTYCTENYPNAFITRYDKISDAGSDLRSGTIDAIVVDDLPAKKLVKVLNGSAKILDKSLSGESYRIAVPKGETEILEYINSVINSMVTSGEIDKIVTEYINSSDETSNGLISQIYNNLINKERYKTILDGLCVTLEITFVALLIGIILGVCIALIRTNRRNDFFFKILKFFANLYVLVVRGTPVVVQLFVIYHLILLNSGLSKVAVAMITFGINSGAYVSEIIRSGIMSIDIGQYEAGRCLGLSDRMTMQKIILPQAFKSVLPTLGSEFTTLIKETSVAGFIGVVDLSRAGEIIRSSTYQPLVPLLSVALIYFTLVAILTYFISLIGRRLRASDRS